MKKIILTIASIFAFGYANAQDVKFGIKAGLDFSSFKYDIPASSYTFGGYTATTPGSTITGSSTGFFIGGYAEFEVSDIIAFQPGLNLVSVNSTTIFNIPVLFKYTAAEKINILAGPSMYFISGTNGVSGSTNFNLDIGGSYDITDNLFFEPRYSIGLTGDVSYSHFLIGIGYKL